MIGAVVLLVVLVLVLVIVARRRRKARSAVDVAGFAAFAVLTADQGRDRHRVPARRGWVGSRGSM